MTTTTSRPASGTFPQRDCGDTRHRAAHNWCATRIAPPSGYTHHCPGPAADVATEPASGTETREGVALSDLRAGMDVQVPEGQRRWYRILAIEFGADYRRLADVEVLGGKDAGRRTQITLFDPSTGYKVRVPAGQAASIEQLR